MRFFPVFTSIIASLSAVHAFETIDHDQVRPFAQPNAATTKEKAAVKYKPQLYIEDGCHPYPAVEEDGTISAGLEWSGDHNGHCKKSPRGSQVYSRGGSYKDKYAIMYAWYFPKGKGHSRKHHDEHRHDWEFGIIWFDRDSDTDSSIAGVTTNIGRDLHDEVPLQPVHVVGSHIKLESYSTFWSAKQGLRLTKKKGDIQDLIQWEQLPKAAQTALNDADFDTDKAKTPVVVPFNDNYFQEKVAASYPFE
ncbi:NPP1-like protein [Phytophthora infestans T30-4]|uniref:NPP1-like protein n=1 Tax=Phytophthora infestans (strain T30-4) TaxID=403677 RepID=D0NEY6_PHYIT|nr:NPP1-like protein [Phytophthora infestans T30-4]EEY56775.1 NPP1-like protein [Phytophthora infestans T30-4]|eukprot:XP_002902103.1 NPP1-like protein [Phytophthora infestans T30-4]